MSDIIDSIKSIGNLIHNGWNLITSFFNFFIFVCKSLINLIGRFLGGFWGQDFNTYFTSQFPVLGQYIGGYVNYFVIGFTIIFVIYFYQFLTRRLKGR